MNQEQSARHWHKRAHAELKTAETLLEKEDADLYPAVLFHCHLSLELALKSVYISTKNSAPPFTHDITELANLLHQNWTEVQQDAFDALTQFAILTRYGDEDWFESQSTKENAQVWTKKTKEFIVLLLS